jgi:hypothetical protein
MNGMIVPSWLTARPAQALLDPPFVRAGDACGKESLLRVEKILKLNHGGCAFSDWF